VNRYEVARAAMGQAESRMERLLLLADTDPGSDSLVVGYGSASAPFSVAGNPLGTMWWHVDGYDDPNIPGGDNLRQVTVCVRWNTSGPDSVQFSQLIPPQ
jgi:hypothetical protein